MKQCRSCGAYVEVIKGEYCPTCGKKTLQEFDVRSLLDEGTVSAVIPIKQSKKVQATLSALSEIHSYTVVGKGKSSLAILSLISNEAYKFPSLLNKLLFRADYSLYEGKKKLTYDSCVSNPAICIYHRNNDENPEAYCYGIGRTDLYRLPNLVGCRQLGLDVGEHFNFNFWGYNEDIFGNYVYYKEKKVKHVKSLMYKYRLCPYLIPEVTQKFLSAWPERINTNLTCNAKAVSANQLLEAWTNKIPNEEIIISDEDCNEQSIKLPDQIFEPPPSYLIKHPAYCSKKYYSQLITEIYPTQLLQARMQILNWCLMEILIKLAKYELISEF